MPTYYNVDYYNVDYADLLQCNADHADLLQYNSDYSDYAELLQSTATCPKDTIIYNSIITTQTACPKQILIIQTNYNPNHYDHYNPDCLP